MDFDDPFEVLELKPCSDKAEIRTAYRQMALKCHPDKTRTTDTEPFRRIKKAYDYLWKMGANKLAQFVRNFTAQKGHRELVQFLIIAAQNGQINEARSLLKRGADPRGTGTVTVDGQMINKVTPLRIAAFKGHLEMCQLLVTHGIDQQDNKWMVCAACYGGHLDIVEHFFGTGIDNCGRLALAAASFHGRDDVLRHLLSEEKASAEQNSDKEETASTEQNSDKEEKASGERSSDEEEKASTEQNSDKEGKASAEQSLDKVSTSSSSSSESRRESAADGESNSDVPSSSQNCGTRKTESEPQFADEMPQNTQQQVRAEKVFQCSGFVDAQRWRSNINADILNRLLNADAPQFNCANALIVAALNGHLNAVEILLEYKVDYLRELFKMTIDEGTTSGVTSLWIATAAGHFEVVQRLLKVQGSDPNKGAKLTIDGKAITDMSPLCIVTSENICELLIENGAQVDQQMGNGQTPLFCACIRGNLEIVKCLVENGADINAVDELDRTPLMAAAFHGHAGLVRYLLERGARIDLATNAGGSTARDFADGEIAKMLHEAELQRATA